MWFLNDKTGEKKDFLKSPLSWGFGVDRGRERPLVSLVGEERLLDEPKECLRGRLTRSSQ